MPRTTGAHDIKPETRVAVVIFLTTLSKEGRLCYGTITRAKKVFRLSRASIRGIWDRRSDPSALVLPRKPYPRRPTRLSPKEVGERVAAVPLCQRQTLRALEAASGIPRSTLHRYLKANTLRRFISRVKPSLTATHKLQRLTWALAQVHRPIVHIDEKWFNMYKASSRYYLTADEELPYRTCPNKSALEPKEHPRIVPPGLQLRKTSTYREKYTCGCFEKKYFRQFDKNGQVREKLLSGFSKTTLAPMSTRTTARLLLPEQKVVGTFK
ncbi:hypothetical protein F443_22697 [Phytophthora nicotianae P1569]|uniref:Transposase Tc1-like domain-containing protein n=1 Tax=Phytophthora nicotianae P1569 TaxID=1317065 RepID=V9DTF4_PHYNI|nr:hypothetical protein F443_22697 [Phytophthora nicotianae P1569]